MSDMAPLPILPPSPPSRISIAIGKLQKIPATVLAKVRSFNNWSATKLKTTSWRVLQLEILGFGLTMIQIGEYGVGVACWVILAIIWVSKVYQVEENLHPFGVLGKFIHSAFAVIVCVLLITVTDLRRPENEPWSNLQKLWKHELPQSYRNALQATEFVVNPDEHYDEGTVIAGIPWMQGSVLTRVQLQTIPELKISNVELKLIFDAQFIHGAQVSDVPNVILQPNKRPSGLSR